MKVVISSGHGKYVAGAKSIIDEVTEARKVTSTVAEYLKKLACDVIEYHDNTTKNKTDNVNGIIAYHNKQLGKLNVSVHFNASKKTDKAMGVEVLYFRSDSKDIAEKVSKAIADASGLKNRGAKYRDNVGFVQRCKTSSILIEVCFVDSEEDIRIYKAKFDEICKSIAESIAGKRLPVVDVKSESKVFRILTGTFNSEKEAEKGLDNLKSTGAISVGYINRDGEKFRILTGTFDSKDKADKAVETIKKKFNYVLYVNEYSL